MERTYDELRSLAGSLYDGGWRHTDKEELIQEYGFDDWEAQVVCDGLEAIEGRYVQDEDGKDVDFEAAVELMDDDLREQLHREMAPCTNQEFYDAYVKAHAAKFNGEKFQI